jgi:DNA polymerase-4
LVVVAPDRAVYSRQSEAMFNLLSDYSSVIQRFSIDECYVDYTEAEARFGPPVELAHLIRQRFKEELGFTVNIGVSTNRVLAKMASELEKPDRVHTLWPEEIAEKMWPLPVERLYMVGEATAAKLRQINLNTIGELAAFDSLHLKSLLKAHGSLIWNYANGIDPSPVVPEGSEEQKEICRSTTLAVDLTDREALCQVLMMLAEDVGRDLRKSGKAAGQISVVLKASDFKQSSRQIQTEAVNRTNELYRYGVKAFDELWQGQPIRLIGLNAGQLTAAGTQQLSMFDQADKDRQDELEKTIDQIRQKYGRHSIQRGGLNELE